MIFKENKRKYSHKKYSFSELLDHEYIRDYADYLYYNLKSPYGIIARFSLGLLRVLLLIFTLIIAIALICLSVFAILAGILSEGIYAVISITVAVIAINAVNYYATYKSHMRRIWYFWVSFFLSIFGYFAVLAFLFR